MRNPVITGSLVRQEHHLLAACGLIAGLAWFSILRGHGTTMGAGLGLTFLFWMTMMVAMMLPPVMPWILVFAATRRGRASAARPLRAAAPFVAGYFSIWALYSLGAAALQRMLQSGGTLSSTGLESGRYTGGVLLVAGLFQLTPLKAACLRHCRSPLAFFLTRWRDGPVGAYRMGLRHGVYCVTCCWALMALCFALGVMNLVWMGALTLLLCAEKIAPAGRFWSGASGLFFVTWGLFRIAIGS